MVKVKIQITDLFPVEDFSYTEAKYLRRFLEENPPHYTQEIKGSLRESTVSFPRVPQVGDKVRLYNYLRDLSEEAKEYAQRIRTLVYPVLAVEDCKIYYAIKLGKAEVETTPLGF